MNKTIRAKNIEKKEQGITLIALVVTIIVLLILAAVAINLSIGSNGIFTRARNAVDKYEMASADEQEELEKISNFIGSYANGNNPSETPSTTLQPGEMATADKNEYVDGDKKAIIPVVLLYLIRKEKHQ